MKSSIVVDFVIIDDGLWYIFRGVRLSCLSCFRVCDFYICLWQFLKVEFIWIYGIELSVHHVIPTFIAKLTNITCQNKSSSVYVSVWVCVRACMLCLNQAIRKRKGNLLRWDTVIGNMQFINFRSLKSYSKHGSIVDCYPNFAPYLDAHPSCYVVVWNL